jgi:hypothetical protein
MIQRLSRGVRVASRWIVPAAVLSVRAAAAAPPETVPLDDVRPGMMATVKTVLSGTTIEDLDVELVSVVRKVGPGQDMILARGLGDRIEHLGVSQGMSGSPVYVDGKLLGALSSTWSFTKEPLFGITPAAQMAKEAEGTLRDGPEIGTAPADPEQSPSASRYLREDAPTPTDRAFSPIAAPLVLSGFDRGLVDLAADLFEPWGFRVIEGGTMGGAAKGGAIEPGATLGVRLVGGDADMTALGTVTWVDGDRVYGWGHPFFQIGDVEMPLVSGYIHAIVPSMMLSFKLGSGGDVVGTLTSDRRSGIAGKLGAGPRLTKFDLTVDNHGDKQKYHYEIIRHPRLGPTLIGIVAANSVLARGGKLSEETVRFREHLVLDDGRDTVVETMFAGNETLGQIVDLLSQAASVIATNPFERVAIDRIDGELTYESGTRLGVITEASLDDDTPRPGETLHGGYTIRDYRGGETHYRFSIPLPDDAPEARYLLLVADSRTAEQFESERAPRDYQPRSLDEFLERIRRLKQTDDVYIHLYRQSEGVLIDGRPMPDLPPSALAILRGAARSGTQDKLPAELVAEQHASAGRFVQGAHTILFEVRKENP